MISGSSRLSLNLALLLALAGCGERTPLQDEPEVLPGPPTLTALVFQSTRRSGATPVGYITQYELWIGPPGSTTPEAGLVIGEATPVFQRIGETLMPTTAAAIAVGDLLEVWRESGAAYGSVQAPPGTPAYYALQVIVTRP
jgi:hypothetical protein